MTTLLRPAFKAGVEAVTAWVDYLNRINVFPVADGDTGSNLVLSLAPLRDIDLPRVELRRRLLMQARGNSGNLAAQFFLSLIEAESLAQLGDAAAQGARQAWDSFIDPKPGTILSFFDDTAAAFRRFDDDEFNAAVVDTILGELEAAVEKTTAQLPQLRAAGVVDSGALGMLVFVDGFLNALLGDEKRVARAPEFRNRLRIRPALAADAVADGFCIDVVLQVDADAPTVASANLGESVTSYGEAGLMRVHFHADDLTASREKLASLGRIVSFHADDLHEQTERFAAETGSSRLLVMTDAAGSITRADAAELGLALNDSYIIIGGEALPETFVDPVALYDAMRRGVAVSTAHPSDFERSECYRKAQSLFPLTLYIAVGSAFTSNAVFAEKWHRVNDPAGKMVVIDSGAASGRLGLAVLATAEFARRTDDAERSVAFAREAVTKCRELMFIDRLKYLAAGGRLSKPASVFGDLLGMKPVVSPEPTGVEKVATVKNRRQQVELAVKEATALLADGGQLMLEYTDNREWVAGELAERLAAACPKANLRVRPFSLTTGAHIGPGSWGVAMLPPISEGRDG
jgi:DegV family protein with EDD domain